MCVVAAVLCLLAGAGAASASSVGRTGGVLVFDPDDGEENRVTVEIAGSEYRVTDRGVERLEADDGCQPALDDDQSVLCEAAPVRELSVGLEDGDDRLAVSVTLPGLLAGDAGADTIRGGGGDERIFGGQGADNVDGGGGDDRIFELDAEHNVLAGGAGSDQITGGSGPDEVRGGPGDDALLFGAEGNDLIEGNEGNDVLDAGFGPDGVFSDADTLSGGAGVDRVSYAQRAEPVRVSMADGPNDGKFGERDDVLADVEQLTGTHAADELAGGPAGDAIDGSGGGDVIDGGGGDDTVDGGAVDAASDTLRGGPGRDTLLGREGGDALDGGGEDDTLLGGSGGDRLLGGGGADTLRAEAGDDSLDGGAGPDAIAGGDGDDTVIYAFRRSAVEVTIDGFANDGEVFPTDDGRTRTEERAGSEGDNVDATNERVTGSQGADTVVGDTESNRLEGASGEDYVDGAAGADTLSGGARNDTVLSRDGSTDRVSCGPGYDYVIADRRDVVARRGSRCEYVDDGSRRTPRARRDVAVAPACAAGQDAELSPPGTTRVVPVEQRVLVPVGTRVDSFDCSVALRVAVGPGRTRTGVLGRRTGTLRVSQSRRAGGGVLTRLRSDDCPRTGAPATRPTATASRFRKAQHRRRFGRIAFPVQVSLDAAVISKRRGVATWRVDDRCGRGATITVSDGRLTVLDLGRDRRVVLGPGDRYRAAAP